ncbi:MULTISPECIES: TetR family transcriptional regulator C-terminal domain-containing protein [unclassified Roseovarius]|uniref:TetR family transcriptional regulator C-terminal domain-containing protein n=1 Tax=unclassified Roseovarius TaxID=2614913 RepID=UPI00273D3607|nr:MULTISPECIES: TetR family transcriptional regulator C-terminal domain-containing protein [unclassified Roseovarius]
MRTDNHARSNYHGHMGKTMNQTIRNQKTGHKPTRRTESKEVRRRQLIDATIQSIAKHGIGGTTMQSVTEIAGLSIGIVNFHFESKQKLFEETLVFLAREHHEQWHRAYEDAGLSAAAKLQAIVDAHFHRNICSRKKLAVWFAFYGEAGRRRVYRKLIEDIDIERFHISIDLCTKIAEEGGYKLMPPRQVANMLEALYDGLWLDILTYPDSYSRETARAHVHGFLSTVFPQHFKMPSF